MKGLFIAVLLTLLVAAALATAMSYDPGYVLIAFGLYTVEASVWVAAALLLAVLLTGWLLLTLLSRMRRGLRSSRTVSSRRLRRARHGTTRGLIALTEGKFERARKSLERAAKRSDDPLLDLLLAARASAEGGDLPKARSYLTRAQQTGPEARLPTLLIQAQLEFEKGELEQAAALLGRLRAELPRQPQMLRLLAQVMAAQAQWPELAALLPEVRRQQALPPDRIDELQRQAWRGQLSQGDGALDQLRERWQALPRNLQSDPGLVASFAARLAHQGAETEAEHLVRSQLKRQWDSRLVERFGRLQGAHPQQQLALAERWLADHPRDAALLLAAGRLALRNQLWGKAREYFENSYRIEPRLETAAELARLLKGLGEQQRAAQLSEQALLVSQTLPSLPLPGATLGADSLAKR